MLNNNLLLLKTIIGRRSIYFKNRYITQKTKPRYLFSLKMNSFNHQLFKIPKNCRETEKKERKNLHFYKMKNHQFSKISKKKQRKVSIIPLLL